MEKKTKKRKLWPLLLLLLLLLIGIGLFLFFRNRDHENARRAQEIKDSIALAQQDSLKAVADSLARLDSLAKADSLARLDSLAKADSLKAVEDSLARLDSLNAVEDSIRNARDVEDSLKRARKAREDSLRRAKEVEDSIARAQAALDSAKNNICNDTIAPWVYPDPTGGLHYKPVSVSFVKSEPCTVYFRYTDEKTFRKWDNKRFSISINEELFYYAVDSCGNVFDIKSKKYVFEKDLSDGRCPKDMTFIESKDGGFCIDQYEWPNRKWTRPVSNVSFTEASDSCFIAGKRLCTSSEWETACRGKYNWNYPYGRTYEQHACVTQERSRKRSGKSGECRGWYAVYDMVGNLAEWTSTPAKTDSRFYTVKGGFWESGKRADCGLERYSYYPQNQHNPVGFRCCKNSAAK